MAQPDIQPRAISAIPWSDNIAVLQQAVYTVLTPVLSPKYVGVLLSEEAMKDYWILAFTHKSVAPFPNNLEGFEFDGDKCLARQFNKYLQSRFGIRLNPKQGTYFQNTYMSKKFQAELSQKLGLDKLVRYDPTVEKVTKSIAEDVFEAFAGALCALVDDKIQNGLGDIFVFNFLTVLFTDVPLSLDEVTRDSISNLKELFDKMKWGDVVYVIENSDRPNLGETKVTVRSAHGDVIGYGYGDQSEAKNAAAAMALENLAKQGITEETASQQLLERKRTTNPAFEEQYSRVQKAIEKLNAIATSQGKATINGFKLTSAGTTKSGSNTVYTYTLDVSYPASGGAVQWRTLAQESGYDQTKVQIALMQNFADRVK